MDLRGKTCLITGANRGIGLALAKALATEPLQLLLLGMRDPKAFSPLESPHNGAREIRAVHLDLSSSQTIEQCTGKLPEFAQIDVLINNAGQLASGFLESQDIDAIYRMLQVNLAATIHLSQLVLPHMLQRRSGKIVNNASISGYAFFPKASTYSATKAGVVGFSESLRRELQGTGVSVLHLVTPAIDTAMMDKVDSTYHSRLHRLSADTWAARVVRAIKRDATVLNPGGFTRLAKIASRGPGFLLDITTRRLAKR